MSAPDGRNPASAPLHQVQAQIRHKPGPPYGLPPVYSVLSLSSPPLRAERVTVFCFRLFRSLVPRSQKSKTKIGWKTYPNFLQISCYNPLAIGQACQLPTVRRGRRFGYVSFGLPITNHFSPITLRHANARSGQAFHLSPIHSASHFSLITAALAAQRLRFEDLVLAFSPGTWWSYPGDCEPELRFHAAMGAS